MGLISVLAGGNAILHGMLSRLRCLAPLLALALVLTACDPNDKVVRASPEKPVDAAKSSDGDRVGLGNTDQSSSGSGLNADTGRGRFGDLGSGASNEDDSSSGGEGGDDLPSDPNSTTGGSSSPGSSSPSVPPGSDSLPSPGSGQGGTCSAGNAGACFEAARPLIRSSRKQAIELYLQACVPSDTSSGDGLACRAAGLLAQSTGDAASATQYLEAACKKTKDPVITACKK